MREKEANAYRDPSDPNATGFPDKDANFTGKGIKDIEMDVWWID